MERSGDEERVREALALAHRWCMKMTPAPRGADVVFRAIGEAADVYRRLRVQGGPHAGSPWPAYVHTPQERVDALKQRLVDLAEGDDPEVLFNLNVQPSSSELATAEAVQALFQSVMVGREIKRDWKLLHMLAMGGTSRQVAKAVGISHARVADRRAVQCGAIAAKLSHLLPDVVVSEMAMAA